MKYDKDSYVVIPNKKTIRGEASTVQSVYFWICDHADAGGECWPSIKTLAKEAGCSERTVDAAVKRLVELGILTKSNRFKDNEQQTNIYQINLVSAPPSATIAPPLAQPLRTELNPIRTQSNITAKAVFTIEPEDKPRKNTKSEALPYEKALRWAENRTGRKFINRVKQYTALKKARSVGITGPQLTERWEELESKPFHEENGIDWCMVVSSFDRK